MFSASAPVVARGLFLPFGGCLEEGSCPLSQSFDEPAIAFTIYRCVAAYSYILHIQLFNILACDTLQFKPYDILQHISPLHLSCGFSSAFLFFFL